MKISIRWTGRPWAWLWTTIYHIDQDPHRGIDDEFVGTETFGGFILGLGPITVYGWSA